MSNPKLPTDLERRAASLEAFLRTMPSAPDTATIGGTGEKGLCIGELREIAVLLRLASTEIGPDLGKVLSGLGQAFTSGAGVVTS